MNWFLDPILKQYADFSGRATRKEYWMFQLVYILILTAAMLVMLAAPALVFLLFIGALAIIIPTMALLVRRLHDIGRSGWWILLSFIPYIGGIVLLVFTCLPSQPGSNKYGANKYGIEPTTVSAPAAPVSVPEVQ